MSYKTGKFNHSDLTVMFGGALSKPHNIFTADAIKVPNYDYTVTERESLGGGWYGGMETNTYTKDNLYLIVKDGFCIGMMEPYAEKLDMKSVLLPINENTNKNVLNFLKKMGLEYRPIKSVNNDTNS